MFRKIPKVIPAFAGIILAVFTVAAQNSVTFREKTTWKTFGFFNSKEDTLQKEFAAKGLEWPAKYVYIRSFKYDAQLEIWVKNSEREKYKLFKTYKVCMQSGTMGPKRIQGDYQVPEGFYYIDEFNPHSAYHLSMHLNYPNVSDKILSDSLHPGNAIYIHGSCVSVGCIPVNDNDIEEIYTIASYAKLNGQDFIPVHVFPFRYGSRRSMEYFKTTVKDNPPLEKFALNLKNAYDKFEETRQLPVILVDRNGDYVID